MDDRFYIIVSGQADVEANGKKLGVLSNGACFGETSYVRGAKRTASITANGSIQIQRVSFTFNGAGISSLSATIQQGVFA